MTHALADIVAPSVAAHLRQTARQTGVLALGAINYDEIFMLPGGLRDDGATHVTKKQVLAGGHAGNCASALAGLGLSTSIMGAVGKDDMGAWLLEDLEERNIDTTYVTRTEEPTGRAVIPVFESGHFMIIERGANDALTDLDPDELVGFDMVALFDPALSVLERLADRLERSVGGPDIYWTPGGHYVRHPVVRRLLPHLRAIFVNTAEATDLEKAHGSVVKQATQTRIVETQGAAGAICTLGTERAHAGGFMTDCVDPTGAGDHFAACFMLADQAELPLADCLKIANLGGMIAVQTVGARAPDFSLERLETEIAAHGVGR